MAKPIHLLIACHNNLAELKKLLTSVNQQTTKPKSITIVDDGSTDGTSKYLEKEFPNIKVLHGNGNLWWTGSLNLGIQYLLDKNDSNQEYLLTINADCVVPKNYFSCIKSKQDQMTIVGSHIVDHKTKKTWDLGERFYWESGQIIGRKSNSEPLDAITTKGTMFPLSIFDKIGLLSNHLPHYGSDYEFTHRAKNKGYQILVSQECLVYNNTKNTGIGDHLASDLTYKQVFDLMFSRRSKLNIQDHFWLITLTCPPKYLILNYFYLISKIIYLLVIPLPPLHRLLQYLRQRYNTKL